MYNPRVAVLIVLFGSMLAFRAAGALGVSAFATLVVCVRWAMAAMFLVTGVSHFTKFRHEMAAMVPKIFPAPMAMVYFTGVCEIAGAVGLLLPQTRAIAGICIILLLVCLFPANAKAAREYLNVAGRPATPLWLRLPIQIMFIGLTWWASRT
jgi:uncharacterized membrane protein